MKGLEEYNLRDLQKELCRRATLQGYTTPQLLAEISRREENQDRQLDSEILPIHREFLAFCAKHFDTEIAQLTGPNRSQNLSSIRQVCLYVAAKTFRLGGLRAARLFGRKDHSSFHHARKVMRQHPELAEEAHVLETNWKNRRNK